MRQPKLPQGMVQVYTGNGKGKTTAALGLAMRAAGRGLKIHIIQFMKGAGPYGEHIAAERLFPRMKITPTGRAGWVTKGAPEPEDLTEAAMALEMAKNSILSGGYDMIILDEINGAVDFGLLEVEEVLRLIEERPWHLELVLTGRNVHERIAEAADLVSEIQERKHYFRRGVNARTGIEN